MKQYKWPLMRSNFHADDFEAIYDLIRPVGRNDWNLDARLTQGPQVRAFEEEFSKWLGVKHSIMVNSGSSANLLTMAALAERNGMYPGMGRSFTPKKVLVPAVTWSSDITSVLHAGFEPVFVDIDRRTLGMDGKKVAGILAQGTKDVVAAFITHCMGYNALNNSTLGALEKEGLEGIEWIHDCCESTGAYSTETYQWGRKIGSYGWASNHSFYYAHLMTTIEGGMICTDNADVANIVRSLRGHGLSREMTYNPDFARLTCPDDLSPDFVFLFPGYNCRSTEINAAIGRSQLKRLDANNEKRTDNLKFFLGQLDGEHYQTDFAVEGCSSYAFTLVLRHPDKNLMGQVEQFFQREGIEYRRGIAGGGNQLRQPYLRRLYGTIYAQFPNAEHVHHYGYVIGNYPDLEFEDIAWLCEGLNNLVKTKVAV